jgi:hypothetical protein
MEANARPLDRLYALVANEEDARACAEISDDACRVVPGNFFLTLCSLVLTKIGDTLVSPKIVLSWLLGSVGAPPFLIAWLVPIRESGSLVPQLAIGAWVRRYPRRSGFWVLGSAMQGACVAGMAVAVWKLDGLQAGVAVLGLLVLFSLSRGFCSVSMKDVQGKCIPKARRGRLAGLATTISGLATLAISVLLLTSKDEPSRTFYLSLLLVGAILWWLAAILFRFVREYDGETAGGGNALREAWQSLKLLRNDAPTRAFDRHVVKLSPRRLRACLSTRLHRCSLERRTQARRHPTVLGKLSVLEERTVQRRTRQCSSPLAERFFAGASSRMPENLESRKACRNRQQPWPAGLAAHAPRMSHQRPP